MARAGYHHPTPIQNKSIPLLLENEDVLAIAQTGTGKTAAFTLPLLQRLSGAKRRPTRKSVAALILAPTRELAMQISDSVRNYGKGMNISHTVVIGGASQRAQAQALKNGVDILVATPGRLKDMMQQSQVDLSHVRHLVLDEADRMLDMGFIKDVRALVSCIPAERQTMLFSATMPKQVATLAKEILQNPVRIEIKPEKETHVDIDQQLFHAPSNTKQALLNTLLEDNQLYRVVVFTRTKRGAERVAKKLKARGELVDSIHGNKSQPARRRALEAFKRGRLRIVVATDVMSRGIDVDDVTHVVNYEIPNDPESYIHRIGRTARAGKSGIAISFCDPSERPLIRDIEKVTGVRLRVVGGETTDNLTESERPKRKPRRRRSSSRRRSKNADTLKAA